MAKRKEFNEYEVCGDITKIFINKRDGTEMVTIIDTKNLQSLINLDYSVCVTWSKKIDGYYATLTYYDSSIKKTKYFYLHRFITNAGKKDYVDHKNHNSLDNRLENLLLTTNAKNSQNRCEENNNSNTGHLNVSFIKSANQYWVQFMKNGERYKWTFDWNEFDEACEFAKAKRIELYS